MQDELFIRDLGDGLILRHASRRDAAALADFNSRIHSDDGPDHPDLRVAAWTRDLLVKPHPTLTPRDFTIIEETASGRIVSSLNLIPQTWAYEGIPFGVGRPELVGTLPEFRGRGLVRTQFDEIHRWCVERDLPVQVITGIPYFYRQFGYEMALELSARRIGFEPNLPKLKKGEKEPCHIRPARAADLSFIARSYIRAQARYAISCLWNKDLFAYGLNIQSRQNLNRFPVCILEDARRRRIGYFQYTENQGIRGLLALGYELEPGNSWLDPTPAVARYLWKKGDEIMKRKGGSCSAFGFMLGTEHPAYEALVDALPFVRPPYAWYLRMPDLPGFIHRIAPVLEKRLADSIAAGYSGEIKISFYRDGLRMVFKRGHLKVVEAWRKKLGEVESAAFPDLTFLQLLFGYRSLEELRFAFKDCYVMNNTARVVLKTLFPRRLSDVLPVA
jgi:hypothetical protein